MINCSIVIPVYKSEEALEILVERLTKVLQVTCANYEIVFVNDSSPDRSWQVIEQLTRQHPYITGIHLMRNYGQHNALLCGIRAAQYEVIITMDDDLQNPPEEIPKLLAKLDEGYDVVYGSPAQMQHDLWRNMASKITKWILHRAMGIKSAYDVSAFRAFRTSIREAFRDYLAPAVNIDVLLTWGTTRFSSVAVQHNTRNFGTSNYTFWKLSRHAINMITGFTVLPLQLASLFGFGFVMIGMLLLCYVIGSYIIKGGSVPGFPFLASTLVLFSGIQLFVLGIIGEYMARLYQRSMNQPPYTIREVTQKVYEQS